MRKKRKIFCCVLGLLMFFSIGIGAIKTMKQNTLNSSVVASSEDPRPWK